MKADNIVDQVAADFGGRRGLAEALGVAPQAIGQWAAIGKFPPARAIELEEKMGSRYRAVNLAPTILSVENEVQK